jgi:PDZ domain-containing protein
VTRRTLSPSRVLLALATLLALAVVALWLVPTNTYVFVPDKAHPVAPLVTVAKSHDDEDGGGIYFVDIFVRKATLIERLWPGIEEGAQLVPKSQVQPDGVSDAQRRAADRREMARSQQVAAAVALRAAGYAVVARPTGVVVDQVATDVPAAGKLLPGDVVTRADGKAVRLPADLRRIVLAHEAGDTVALDVRRDDELTKVVVRTVPDAHHRGQPVIGILLSQAATIKLPLSVKIDAGNVGGPSAGLAFALQVLEDLGKDVDHGQRVAATGALELDGTVSEIGGIRQKTIGVRRTGIKVFLVPGENAAEARRYAHGIRIVPVHSFRQALRVLATLTKKAA